MSKVHLDHTVVGYFLTLPPGADVQEFERSLSSQVAGQHSASYTLSKALNAERRYLWTIQIAEAGGVDRQAKPLIVDDLLSVIADLRGKFQVEVTQAFWSPALTQAELVGEFNKLPFMMGTFGSIAG